MSEEDSKTPLGAAAIVAIPTSTTDLEFELGSPNGLSSGVGDAEPLSPDSEGGSCLPQLPQLPSDFPSLGSVEHGSGRCRACVWVWKPQGCRLGASCNYCHLCPASSKKAKKPKGAEPVEVAAPSKSPRYVNLEYMAPPGLEAQGELQPQKLTLPFVEMEACKAGAQGRNLHAEGECKPCAWFWHPDGCQNGEDCDFCHLCPPGELKARRKEWLRLQRAQKKGQGGGRPVVMPGEPEFVDLGEAMGSPGSSNFEEGLPAALPADFGPGALPSLGSASHGVGCRPCAWFWKSEGCKNGKECRHCHLCPEGEIRRKKKQKQEDIKKTSSLQRGMQELTQDTSAASFSGNWSQTQMLQQMQTSMMMAAAMAQMSQVGFPGGSPHL